MEERKDRCAVAHAIADGIRRDMPSPLTNCHAPQKHEMSILKPDEVAFGAVARTLARVPSRNSGLLIGLDCDGVLASDRLLWRQLRERFPADIPARYDDLASFEWPRATDATTALCMALSADPSFMGRLAPMPAMMRAIRHLSRRGFRFHVITARPACVRRATWRWLHRYGVGDCIEHITCVESGLAKVPLAHTLGCIAFVEDNHTTAEAMGADGNHSYLLDAPYNRLSTRYSRRVRDWPMLVAELSRCAAPKLSVPAFTIAAGVPEAALAS